MFPYPWFSDNSAYVFFSILCHSVSSTLGSQPKDLWFCLRAEWRKTDFFHPQAFRFRVDGDCHWKPYTHMVILQSIQVSFDIIQIITLSVVPDSPLD